MEEDNFCPICQHGYLSVMYGDKQYSKEEAGALYKKAQQAEVKNDDEEDDESHRSDPNQMSFDFRDEA